MKECWKIGFKLFGKLILVNLMCFFLVLSLSVISMGLFTHNIGYTAYGTTSESDQQVELYTHYYDDGDDEKLTDYEAQGYTVTQRSIRSPLSNGANAVFLIITQVFTFMILVAFIYPNIWELGTKDSNLVKFKHMAEDKAKGFKIGLVTVLPNYIVLIILAVLKRGIAAFPMVLYKFCHSSFYSFIELIIGGNSTLGDLAIWRLCLLFLLPLIVVVLCGAAYSLGYHNFSIGEKFVYKKQ